MLKLKEDNIYSIDILTIGMFCKLYKSFKETKEQYDGFMSKIELLEVKQKQLRKMIDKNIIESLNCKDLNKQKTLNSEYYILNAQDLELLDALTYQMNRKCIYDNVFIPIYRDLFSNVDVDKYYSVLEPLIEIYDMFNEIKNSSINYLKKKVLLRKILKYGQKKQFLERIYFFNQYAYAISEINEKYSNLLNMVCRELSEPIDVEFTVVDTDLGDFNVDSVKQLSINQKKCKLTA